VDRRLSYFLVGGVLYVLDSFVGWIYALSPPRCTCCVLRLSCFPNLCAPPLRTRRGLLMAYEGYCFIAFGYAKLVSSVGLWARDKGVALPRTTPPPPVIRHAMLSSTFLLSHVLCCVWFGDVR
jgi:hypothetical protein